MLTPIMKRLAVTINNKGKDISNHTYKWTPHEFFSVLQYSMYAKCTPTLWCYSEQHCIPSSGSSTLSHQFMWL